MGRETIHPWCVLICALGAAYLYLGATANVAFAPGLGPRIQRNNSLKDKMYLEILKDKIQRELDKYRNSSQEEVTGPVVEPVVEVRGEPRFRPQFVSSGSPGKNLLNFTINPNTTDLQEDQVSRVNLWIHVWQKEKKRKKQMRRKKKGKMINISVFNHSAEDNGVVATLRTRIQFTKWFRISLPVSLVQNVLASKNNTMVLRIECKRCNRRTRLMLPQNSKKKCKKNKRKRQKKRKNKRRPKKTKKLRNSKRGCGTARNYPSQTQRLPFMVIEQRYNSLDRRKRSLTCNPADLIYRNGTVTSRRCCRMSSYVEFSDMDLDDYIVTPGGYQASRCVGRCPRMRRTRNRSSRRNRGRNRNRNTRSVGRMKRGKCRAVQTSPLTVWLFNSEHNLVQAQLPDLVVRNCDCR